jgi:hypothetical protein
MVDGIATLCSLSIEPPEPHKQCRYTFYDFELLELQWTARATDFITKELLRVMETGGRAAMRIRRTTDSSHTSSHGTSITNVYVCKFPVLAPLGVCAYCVPTVPSRFEAIFFMKPLSFPPLPPFSNCDPDIEGPI